MNLTIPLVGQDRAQCREGKIMICAKFELLTTKSTFFFPSPSKLCCFGDFIALVET